MVGIREWAKSKGYKDEDIEYDPTTKKVTIRGLGTVTPTSLAGGTAVGNRYVLDDMKQRSDVDTLAQRRMKAQADYVDIAKNAPKTDAFTYKDFSYDQNVDPAYQSALSQARTNIQQGVRSNEENMNRRGLLNSTITGDRSNQISANAMADVESRIAPQLAENAYNRYTNERNQAYQQYRQEQSDKMQSWQDMVRVAAAQVDMADKAYGESKGELEKARQERMAQAQYLTQLTGKRVTPTIDPSGMERQVAGVPTLAERQQRDADRNYNLSLQRINQPSIQESPVETVSNIDDKKVQNVYDIISTSPYVTKKTVRNVGVPGEPEEYKTNYVPTDNNSKAQIKKIIDSANLNDLEKSYLYQAWGISSVVTNPNARPVRPTSALPMFTSTQGNIALKKKDIEKQIVSYILSQNLSDAAQEQVYIQMMKQHGYNP